MSVIETLPLKVSIIHILLYMLFRSKKQGGLQKKLDIDEPAQQCYIVVRRCSSMFVNVKQTYLYCHSFVLPDSF